MQQNTVKTYLDELFELVENPYGKVDAQAIIKDLQRVTLNETSEDEIGLLATLILSSDNSILLFLEKTTSGQYKNLTKARAQLLDFLLKLMKLLGNRVTEFAINIKNTCFGIFRREDSSAVSVATFKPILKILRLQSLDEDKLAIREMAESYLNVFTCGRQSQSVRACILQILGKFAEFFPQKMFDKFKVLLRLYLDCLQVQFNKKDPEYQIITGSIKGLTSLLINFSGDFVETAKNLDITFKYITNALNPPSGVRSYDIPRASMKFLNRHSELFKQHLTENNQVIYKALKNYSTNKYKPVRYNAIPAIDKFFSQIANEISSVNRGSNRDLDIFKYFMKEFWNGIDSQTSGLLEVSVCIRGFGKFAKATKKYLARHECNRETSQQSIGQEDCSGQAK